MIAMTTIIPAVLMPVEVQPRGVPTRSGHRVLLASESKVVPPSSTNSTASRSMRGVRVVNPEKGARSRADAEQVERQG